MNMTEKFIFMATDLGPVRATQEKKKKKNTNYWNMTENVPQRRTLTGEYDQI